MPVILTYDLQRPKGADTHEAGRIQSMFERFRWQKAGSSTYRYPAFGEKSQQEDWLNHVIPALMLFRTIILASGRQLNNYTLEAHSSSAFNIDSGYGTPPSNSPNILETPSNQQFGKTQLLDWLCMKSPYSIG